MKSYGKFHASIKVNGQSTWTEVMVFEGVRDNLLSYDSSLQLRLINLTCSIQQDINDPFRKKIFEAYPQVFSGKIGRLKGVEIKLHIDPEVKPVYEPHRRIPFHMREKVEAELEAMESDGIIEDVDGPTPWVSEMMALPKPSNPEELRIVVDSRAVNKAITRERHVTPTIEDLMIDLNGAKIISKLDLKGSFHQLALAKESRNITTFRTPKGLKRYTCLTQCLNSSMEMFQHTWVYLC